MSKYISEFQQSGISTLDMNLVLKNWNDMFFISTWKNEDGEKYTFVIKGKRKNTILCKTQISKEQTNEIVLKMKLIHVKDSSFISAGCYYTKSFIDSEINRITELKKEKQRELDFIDKYLFQYEMAY